MIFLVLFGRSENFSVIFSGILELFLKINNAPTQALLYEIMTDKPTDQQQMNYHISYTLVHKEA